MRKSISSGIHKHVCLLSIRDGYTILENMLFIPFVPLTGYNQMILILHRPKKCIIVIENTVVITLHVSALLNGVSV